MKKITHIIQIAIFLLVLLIVPMTVSAWGDNSGIEEGRPEYTIDQINHGDLGDTITFNSISDGVIGHEFNFVGAREDTGTNVGADNLWNETDINVENGKYYLIRLYVHNNNPDGYSAVAENVHVSFSIPSMSDDNNQIQVDGFINSSNAMPTEYWDDVVFRSDHPFHLEYVSNSAFLENNGIGSRANNGGKVGGVQLSDEIIDSARGGVLIGYDKLDGKIPGCYQYACYIGITVKAVYDYEYSVETHVRPAGTKGDNWTKNLQANIGDRLEYQIEYENTSDETQNDVALRDVLPENVEYIPGTTRIWNEFHDGDTIDQDDLVTNGIAIGSYGPGANAYVRFNAKIIDEDLACGSNTIVNWGQGWVGDQAIQDYAAVVLYKDSKSITIIILLAFSVMTCLLIIAALLQKTYKNRHL